jgi:hypothetical protein
MTMKDYLSSKPFKIGLAIVVLGSAPLFGIIVLAKIGLWPDPDPNPIGPGLLCFVSFWPGVILMCVGVLQVRARRSQ